MGIIELKNEISLLKQKISMEIDSFRLISTISYIADPLYEQMQQEDPKSDNEEELNTYKAFLSSFLENVIGYVDLLIQDETRMGLFDNRLKNSTEVEDVEKEIDKILKYLIENFSVLGNEYLEEYKKLKNEYDGLIEQTKKAKQNEFDQYLCIGREQVDEEKPLIDLNGEKRDTDYGHPVLYIFKDTKSIEQYQVRKLGEFKDKLNKISNLLIENDIKFKAIFKRAYEVIRDPQIIKKVEQIEKTYLDGILDGQESIGVFANDALKQLQGRMQEVCDTIKQITENEEKKQSYYDKITKMSPNKIDPEEIKDIETFVLENNMFVEEFYSVLYFIIELEKYSMFYESKPTVYSILSEQSKIILERMFYSRQTNNSDEESDRAVLDIKKNGYLSVIDKQYKEFLKDNLGHAPTTIKNVDRTGYSVKNSDNEYIKSVVIKSPEKGFYGTYPGYLVNWFLGRVNRNTTLEKFGDIYWLKYSKDYKDKIAYFDRRISRIRKLPYYYEPNTAAFGYYFFDNKKETIVTDSKFNTIQGFGSFVQVSQDLKNRQILVFNKETNTFTLYNDNFSVIKSFVLDYDVSTLCRYFSDNIITFKTTNGNHIYYDVDKMCLFDSFKHNFDRTESAEYNNDIYRYYESNMFGYKNSEKEVVIPPQFSKAWSFHSGVAFVNLPDKRKGFIDKFGDFFPYEDTVHYDFKDKEGTLFVDPETDMWLIRFYEYYTYALEATYHLQFSDTPEFKTIYGIINNNSALSPFTEEKGQILQLFKQE